MLLLGWILDFLSIIELSSITNQSINYQTKLIIYIWLVVFAPDDSQANKKLFIYLFRQVIVILVGAHHFLPGGTHGD